MVDLNRMTWVFYLNTLFWNLNYWDSISTFTGWAAKADDPCKTLPRALFYALILVVFGYFFPPLTGTGAIPVDRKHWSDGYLSEVSRILGGVWLILWVQTSNSICFIKHGNVGGWDELRLLPTSGDSRSAEFFAKRSRHGTPVMGILFSASGVILLSWLSFQEIVAE